MITLTFQFTDIAAATALLAQLNGQQVAAIVPAPRGVSADEKAAVIEAPGKPSAAKTARSQPTAAAAPSPTDPVVAAPAPSTEATQPTAAAASASPLVYADLQKVVLQLHAIDPSAPVPIAKALGFDSFKPLKEAANSDKIPAAHAAVVAKITELKAA